MKQTAEAADRFRREGRPIAPEVRAAFVAVTDGVSRRLGDAAPFAAMSRAYLRGTSRPSD